MANFEDVVRTCFQWYSVMYVEFIGTFIFISVILQVAKLSYGAFAIGLTLAAMILFGGQLSGGHFNPAVTLASYLNGGVDGSHAVLYAISQCIAGALAVLFHQHVQVRRPVPQQQ